MSQSAVDESCFKGGKISEHASKRRENFRTRVKKLAKLLERLL